MKKLLMLVMAVCVILPSMAEDAYISVAMPKDCILDNNTKSLLKNKLLNMASLGGVAPMESCAIAMIPEVNVLSKELVEGGMRNITTLELSVTITVRNIMTDAVFNTTSISLRGDGYSEIEAMRSAIRTIVPERYAGFVKVSKEKIISYYRNNTSALIAKANTLANQQLFDEALATLSSYPESLSGYQQVAAAISAIFKKAQTQYCSEILQAARAAYAQRDFEEAANIASAIDATSSCATEAKALLNSIRRSADQQYKDELETQRQETLSQERVATATIKAARDVAVAYYKRQNNYIFFW